MSIRLFVGIPMPDEVLDRLLELEGGVPGARWLEPDAIHLTLRFVGEVDGHAFRDIRMALAEVRRESFEMALKGVGFFPPRGPLRILWAGVAPQPKLVELRNAVERAVVRSGQEPERRKFHAHVTLARLNGSPPGRVARFLENHALFRTEPFLVDHFLLYSSTLHPKGSQYHVEETYLLDPPGDPAAETPPETPGEAG
jgi:2'-5' RNA ligase